MTAAVADAARPDEAFGPSAKNAGRADPVLALRCLVRERRNAGSAFSLRIPEMELQAGLFYGVYGPSGSGKSTLLDILALVLRPTTIERFEIVTGAGSRIALDELWRRRDETGLAHVRKTLIGYVLQSGGLIGFLTVRQNLAVPFELIGRTADHARIESMAARFGIASELDKKPRNLSGGQRQRAAILRALMLEPAIVLADEPTAALDQLRARQMVTEFKTLAREAGSTIVMVSHDRDLLGRCADRVLALAPRADPGGVAVTEAA